MSRHVPGWENPYTVSRTHQSEHAQRNYEKVLQRKAEKLFSLQMASNGDIEHLTTLQSQLAQESRSVVVRERKTKAVVAKPTLPQVVDLRAVTAVEGFVRALEVSLSGGVAWTAENDGGISVRSSTTGAVVISIPPRGDGSTVDVLFSTPTHMWAGLSDGTVIVFDALVFVQVTEGRFHTGAVTGFCLLSDGRVLSFGEDGAVVKWDSEARNFEAITRILPQGLGSITAGCSKGMIAFLGASSGALIALQSDKGTQEANFEGHQQPITAIAVVEDYLFSACADNTVRIWNASSGAPLKVQSVEATPCALVPMLEGLPRLWVAFRSGVLQVWRARPEDGFSVERTVRVHEGRQLIGLKSATALETLKVWTMASDGVNKVWSSTYHRAEESLRAAVDALRSVITQDTIELDRWRGLVLRLDEVTKRRKAHVSAALEAYHRDSVLRRYVWTWMRFVKMRQEHRRRTIVAAKLESETRATFARSIFARWYTRYREAQAQSIKRKFAKVSASMHDAGLKAAYAMKVIHAYRENRAERTRILLVDVLARQNARAFQATFFRRWMRWIEAKRSHDLHARNAKILQWFNYKLLLRRYLSVWMKVRERIVRRQHTADYVVQLIRLNGLRHAQLAMDRWRHFHHAAQALQKQRQLAEVLNHSARLTTLRNAYLRWQTLTLASRRSAAAAHNEELLGKLSAIRGRYGALSALLEEQRKLAALKKKAIEDDAAIEASRRRIAALERERLRLSDALAQKELDDQQQELSTHEQLAHVMSQLKASVINYYADYALFHQTKERIRAGQSVTKIFLEAHQAVKRVVVEVTRNPHLSAFERWPLSPELIQKIPGHQLAVLLGAIKAMIITFDVMGKSDHDQLTSDQEIVLNASWLMLMAKWCVMQKKKSVALRK